MEEELLKDRIAFLLEGATVKAAVFHTFNFDPKLFENYILPLIMPNHIFSDNPIYNIFKWRKLYKQGEVPPVTVYFDDAVKSENAPNLPYAFYAISMANVGKNKGNFHPKTSFILYEDKSGKEILLFLIGSNNITQKGWCENREIVGDIIFVPNSFCPSNLLNNINRYFRNVIAYRSKLSKQELSEAETLIQTFLNRRTGLTSDTRIVSFYHPYNLSFIDFLEQEIFTKEDINTVEIISPYFINTNEHLSYLKSKGIKNIKIQVPFNKECASISEDLFELYKNNNVQWYLPKDLIRNDHSKIYRFIGNEKVYLVIGSVNFTAPAWESLDDTLIKVSNFEAALLKVFKKGELSTILHEPITNTKHLKFGISEEDCEDKAFERIKIPDFNFMIDWKKKIITWSSINIKNNCCLILKKGERHDLTNNKGIISNISEENLKELAAYSMVNVEERVTKSETIHHRYYLNQKNYESRPLLHNISSKEILDAWDLIDSDDEEAKEWLATRIAQKLNDLENASGIFESDNNIQVTLLNDWARHFYGLVKLSDYLFNSTFKSKTAWEKHILHVEYYLFNSNFDTLVNYISDLKKGKTEGKLLPTFYWLVLKILSTEFYDKEILKTLRKNCKDYGVSISTVFFSNFSEKASALESELEQIAKELPIDQKKAKKLDWAENVLKLRYELSK